MTGGGSGGHITPILAVAHALKRIQPGLKIVYIGQKGDKLIDIPAADPAVDAVYAVPAGKFRRYHGEGFRQLLDVPTQVRNVRDGFRVLAGLWQSYWLLRKLKPSVIFTRGGFVSVPVALGGKLNGIPYITHDSDSVPSLANRIIARWASLHAVALPEEVYPYPRPKTKMVGIPLNADYQPVTPAIAKQLKHQVGIKPDAQLLLVTGGGNGAEGLNQAVAENTPYLLKKYPKLHVAHIAGRALEKQLSNVYDKLLPAETRKRVEVIGFTTDFVQYSGAADVIIARGGATNLAEFAVQGKACIIVPAEQLVGGHQVKNAQVLADRGAIELFTQAQAEQERRLGLAVGELLDNPEKRAELGKHLATFAKTDAAHVLSMVLLEIANAK